MKPITYLGIDISSTSLKLGVLLEDGKLIYFNQLDIDGLLNQDHFIHVLSREIDLVLRNYPSLAAIGIGAPGKHASPRVIMDEVSLSSLRQYRLIEKLAKYYPRFRIRLMQDIEAIAVGEYRFGTTNKAQRFLLANVNSALECVAIINGEVLFPEACDYARTEVQTDVMFDTEAGSFTSSYGETPAESVQVLNAGKQILAKSNCDVGDYGKTVADLVDRLDINLLMVGQRVGRSHHFYHSDATDDICDHVEARFCRDYLNIVEPSLGNKAGIIGAASLVMNSQRA